MRVAILLSTKVLSTIYIYIVILELIYLVVTEARAMQLIDEIHSKQGLIKKQAPAYFGDADFVELPHDDESTSGSFYVSNLGDNRHYDFIYYNN